MLLLPKMLHGQRDSRWFAEYSRSDACRTATLSANEDTRW
jgi:hypothetical protein